jgi:hypothetical protein
MFAERRRKARCERRFMGERFGHRWQIVLVGLLFLASLATLLSSSLAAFQLPQYEAEMQTQLIAASRRMADAAASLFDNPDDLNRNKTPAEWHPRLARITAEALADLYGVEGGFYFRGEWTGYAFPNDLHAPPEPPLPGKHLADKKGKGKHRPPLESPVLPERRDPPPKERDFIYALCKASLNADLGDPPIAQTTVIPPSRILVVTEAVGRQRPAEMAAWVMTRLTRPENMAADLRRYLVAANASSANGLATNCAAPSISPPWAGCWPASLMRCAIRWPPSAPPPNCISACRRRRAIRQCSTRSCKALIVSMLW